MPGLDLRIALRGVGRSRALLIGSALSLGLGLGGAIVGYQLVDALLLRPFPQIADPARVIRIRFAQGGDANAVPAWDLTSYPMLRAIERGVPGLERVAGVAERLYDDPRAAGRSLRVALVTPAYFAVFGTRPSLGGTGTDAAGADGLSAAVLGDGYWRRAFGSRRDVVGTRLRLGHHLFTIAGVMPPGFRGDQANAVDVWVPLEAVASDLPDGWRTVDTGYWLRIVGRLRTGRDAATLAGAAPPEFATMRGPGAEPVRLVPSALSLARGPDGTVLPDAWLKLWILGLALLVLFVAALNVSSLLLASAIDRRTEVGVRLAFGASRWQSARPAAAQAAILAGAGLVCAVPTVIVLNAWLRFAYPDIVALASVASLLRMTVVAVGLTALAATVAAAGPVVFVARRDLGALLRVQGRDRGAAASGLRTSLVVVQAAMAVLLLGVSFSLARSLVNIRALYIGIDVHRVVVAELNVESARLTRTEADALFADLLGDVRSLPGVSRAAVATSVPFLAGEGVGALAEGNPYPLDVPGGGPYLSAVTPDYFATTGLGIVAGRGLTEQDHQGSEFVAVISESLARFAWPGQEAIGRCLTLGSRERCTRVVGIARDGRLMRLQEPQRAVVFIPLAQYAFMGRFRALLVRTDEDPDTFAPALRAWVQARSPRMESATVVTMRDLVTPQWRQWSLGTGAFGLMAMLGLVLAGVGIYASVSMFVTTRSSELAIRAAFGAPPVRLAAMALYRAAVATLGGVVLGSVVLIVAGRLMAPLLFETTVAEPLALAASAGLFLAISVAVTVRPALQASSPDVLALLRAE